MSCYVLAKITVNDREAYRKYEEAFDEVLEKTRGKILIVDEDPLILEGEWNCTRTVLLRFPDEEGARSWFESDEYQSIAKYRRAASTGNIVIIRPK